ncbi:alpha/beta fold hydrolase [Chryseosolibacter indicus]|uniref:Alpha/beta hydrolase n=1 Tax=Chryseosolibacter indicus TaxID=2782351 RepID=A0ABS5VP98_9BACT|nr:alpha/beta hydrolase [Chryseosolibacter indicus]MBT1702689.1 alpha/beta hydrolase [Chryseosolibacter indicus]
MSLHFIERGSGHPVILIHGFPLNQQIWDNFATSLSSSFRVFTIDLPGFGNSPALNNDFSIEDVASTLLTWIKEVNIKNAVLVGHSLGGYVALAMVEQEPTLFSGLVLFHSTAFADSEEKKQNRNKSLEFIEKNGVQAFTSNFIAPLFADNTNSAIALVKDISIQASADTVTGYTKAMRDRKDRTVVLKQFPKHILIISGQKDAGITVESVEKQAQLSPRIEFHVLENVAHMGMLENEGKTLELLSQFVLKSNQP